MKIMRLLIILIVLSLARESFANKIYNLKSPNEILSINLWLTETGEPVYTISSISETIIRQSKLGVVRSDGNFSADLILDSVSNVKIINDTYKLLHGKRLNCSYTANQRIFYLKNSDSKIIEIIFQVSNDGVAFRYHFPEKSESKLKIYNEVTSYHFDASTKAFLQPCPEARTGWSFSQPSYEEYYQMDIKVGTVSPYQAGWILPALFNYKNYWISITETAVDTNYCGTRLSQFSPDGEYSVQFPQPQESRNNESALPESTLPWFTPWRIIAISENIGGLVESTIGTDLAIPQKYDVSSWLKPGIASWSWVILKDDSTNYETQKGFIDFASKMNWEYCLIDALWDTQIGYEKVKELSEYAKIKNVKILLWYNSAGDWNTTPLTPRDKMITKEIRRKEFQKIHEMGIAGIKVDFFGGDGQSMMKYYIDILKDAADYKIAVNFHGCTLPRGWYRTYPNLVTMESIRGEEYVTFDQSFADQQPSHCAMIPYTRNLFDPMDFTPVNFSGIPNINRKTTKGFEIALSVLFTSGIQHIAETPKGMNMQKDFVQEYMRTLPERWEDVKFIEGYPGKYVVLARKSENEWYIAGINGESEDRIITLDLPFINKNSRGKIITDSVNSENLIQEEISLLKSNKIVVKPNSGFVIKIK